MWSVFFLIPVGRGIDEQRISPEQYEEAFERLWIQAGRQPYGIKTTEAPHYRRFVLQRHGDPLAGPSVALAAHPPTPNRADRGSENQRDVQHGPRDRAHRAPLGVRDGNGIMFVGHTGEIFPAGFLPIECGRFPQDSVVNTYQNHATFLALRDPDQFGGDCGVCEYRYLCGGSRSRAYAVTGDPLAGEPDCVYEPGQRSTIQRGAGAT
jgi:MoaA/NifB/PqqE/SkfB family radical SAM enzyme